MPRTAAGLSAAKVRTAAPGRYGDGGGLYLLVRENGTRFWVFRWVRDKRMREMGLGAAGAAPSATSLADARVAAVELRRLVRSGVDPLAQRDAEKVAAKAAVQQRTIKAITFKSAAERYIEAHEAGWRNTKHAAQWGSTLATYAYPHFGDIAIADIGTEHVRAALEPVWSIKPETASRVRGRIEAILDYATTLKWRSGDNPARWKGHLANLLPARSKVRRVEHHAALPWSEIGLFMTALRSQAGVGAKALEFAILTAARTGEVIGAAWGEIDLAQKVWTIPAGRMKGEREHRVPLAAPAVEILDAVAKLRSSLVAPTAPIFPGARRDKPLSNMALLATLRRMDRGDLTAHGFRSTFRDWTAESTGYAREVAEQALAHALESKVEAAYRRGDLFEKRRQLMADWAVFCATQPLRTS
jgi:integrase